MKTKIQVTLNNFSKICRICLLSNELMPINSPDTIRVFKEITNIEVKNDDQLPKNICKSCLQFLEEIRLFIENSKHNYSILLLVLNENDNCNNLTIFDQNEDTKDSLLNSETETKEEIDKNPNFQCAQCNIKFDLKKLLILHIKQVHGRKCDICKKGFNSNLALLKHKKIHSGKKRKINNYNCTECDRILTSHSALDNHMKTHTGDRPYKCLYCDKNFAFSGSLTVHTRIHTGQTPYKCTICNKEYCSSSSLKKHKEKKHFDGSNEKNYNLEDLEKVQCKICEKMLHKHGFGTHMRIHTNERKEFICRFCSKHFKKMSHLDRHVRIHTGERPFVCVVCKKPFTQEGDLKRHWVIHSGQKEFQCQHCGKLYFTKSALDTHITNHTGTKKTTNIDASLIQNDKISQPIEQRSFLCTVCGKSFTASNSLKVHIRLHTGDCPFVCTYCGKAYTNTSNLKRHVMRNHTLEKPYVCMICHKGFHDSTNLKRHVNRVHSVLETRDRNEDSIILNEENI